VETLTAEQKHMFSAETMPALFPYFLLQQ